MESKTFKRVCIRTVNAWLKSLFRQFSFQSNINVERMCPNTEEEIEKARKRMKCGNDLYGRNRYMCLPDKKLKSLKEFCFNDVMGLQEKGIYLRNKARFSCRITYEVQRCRNVVWNREAEAIVEAFTFQTIFRHQGGFSATTTIACSFSLFYHGNKIKLIAFLYRKTK